MPVSLSTNRRFEIVLDGDAAAAAESPAHPAPIFYARYLSSDELIAHRDAMKEISAITDRREFNQRMDALLGGYILAWTGLRDREGKTILYGEKRFSEICTEPELLELANKCHDGSDLSEVDAKKSKSPSSSPGAESATTAAPPESANTTPPAPAK
jgi:hypothetical protein